VSGYLFLAGLLLLFGVWAAALVDSGTTDRRQFDRNGIRKDWTVVLIFLTGGIGGIFWFAVLRARVKD